MIYQLKVGIKINPEIQINEIVFILYEGEGVLPKTVNLRELPNVFISSGMTISELCEYLGVSEELIHEWERFFNLFPDKQKEQGKVYTQKRIRDFMKVKDSVEKGTPLHEIKRKIFKISTDPVTNPFENRQRVVDTNIEKEELAAPIDQEEIISPFLTQINKANERIGELILEKARIVENAAVEKAGLMSELKTLKHRNVELLTEKDELFRMVREKEEQLKRTTLNETTLVEALKFSHNLLQKKEEDIEQISGKIELYEEELREKNSIIFNQSQEISRLLEKQNKKWWHFIRDLFF